MHLTGNPPGFCVIAPTAYLDPFALYSTDHLVLAHLVDTDDTYADFYNNLGDNHLIIMDNGAFELGESYDPNELIGLGQKCDADVIVLPDYPFQEGSVTIGAAMTWNEKIREAGFKTMFVPQSKTDDVSDWIKTYQWAAMNPDIDMIGMSILGIPNAIPHIEKSFARVVMTQKLLDMNVFEPKKHHHYLGLNAGPALEVPSLLRMGVLDTCDSSGPVWAGICGHQYSANTDSFQTVRKIEMEVNFQQPLTKKQQILDNIAFNIEMTLSLFDSNYS